MKKTFPRLTKSDRYRSLVVKMPAKGTKLTSSAKKARAAKAASTRRKNKISDCKKKCVSSGGAACSSGRKKKPAKRASAKKGAIPVALQPWTNFLASFREGPDSNGLKGREIMSVAAEMWRGMSAAQKKKFA